MTLAASAPTWYSTSSLVLVAANLLPLYGVLAWDWPVFPALMLFWLENVLLGALSVLRMLCARPQDPVAWAGKLLMVPHFCLLYGMFTAAHGFVVFIMFGGEKYSFRWPQVFDPAIRAIADFDLLLPLAALAGSHLYSFARDYLGTGEYRRASLSELGRKPYNRAVVLHVAIFLSAWGVAERGSPTWALVTLIVFKIALDLNAHLREHRAPEANGA